MKFETPNNRGKQTLTNPQRPLTGGGGGREMKRDSAAMQQRGKSNHFLITSFSVSWADLERTDHVVRSLPTSPGQVLLRQTPSFGIF